MSISEWEDLPERSKVVGRRRLGYGPENGDALQRLANDLGEGRVTWPKGVFRFKSHEEADAWWIEQMRVRK